MPIIVKILSVGFNTRYFASGQNSFNTEQSILDWQLKILRAVFLDCIFKIPVGFKSYERFKKYNYLNFFIVPGWETQTSLSYFNAIEHNYFTPVTSTYIDTVFYPETVKLFNEKEEDLLIIVDSKWRKHFKNRPQDNIKEADVLMATDLGEVEFKGLIRFSPKILKILKNFIEHLKEKSFMAHFKTFSNQGFDIEYIDICCAREEMNEDLDLVQFILGSKVEAIDKDTISALDLYYTLHKERKLSNFWMHNV